MIDWEKPFSAAYHPARAYLLQRALFALLAFDVWLTMLSHAGRYGVGGFNVTHFAWLDRVLPMPSAAAYLALLTLCGLCSLLLAFSGMAAPLKLFVCVLYTLAWASSFFDSYQHHYLLSWLTLWSVFVPDVDPREAQKRDVMPVRGFGLPMTAMTCAIVYAFTGISKAEPDWRAGFVLERLSHSRPVGDAEPGVMDPLRDLLMNIFGCDGRTAWTLIATSVIALQWIVAVGYLAASMRDERPSRLKTWLTSLALCGAVSFHAFAEIGNMFDIGWFSYYMLAIAFTLLAPSHWVAWVVRRLSLPLRIVEDWLSSDKTPGVWLIVVELVVAALICVFVGLRVNLPGATSACAIFAAVIFLWGGVQLHRAWLVSAQWLIASGALTAALFGLTIQRSNVRFDYYRLLGGELQTLGLLDEALAAYRTAERYAPRGQSRQKAIRDIEMMLHEQKRGKASLGSESAD